MPRRFIAQIGTWFAERTIKIQRTGKKELGGRLACSAGYVDVLEDLLHYVGEITVPPHAADYILWRNKLFIVQKNEPFAAKMEDEYEDEIEDTCPPALKYVMFSLASAIALQIVVTNKLSTPFPMWAIGFTFFCCVLGAIVYGVPQLEGYISYHIRAEFWMHCVMVSLFTVHFALVNNCNTEMTYLQLVMPIYPLLANILNDRNQYALQDGVICFILAIKAFIHFKSSNYYGLAFCTSHALLHFFIEIDQTFGEVDIHTLGFIYNKYFIIRALYR